MGSTIFLVILLLVIIGLATVGIFARKRAKAVPEPAPDRYGISRKERNPAKLQSLIFLGAAALLFIVGIIIAFASTFYTNPVNTAKVFVSFDGTVQGVQLEPGAGFKAPWTKAVEFDLASQKLSFAGNGNGSPSYTGGDVNGQQITSAVKGGAQSNFDLQLTYNIEAKQVEKIYKDYRSQENFSSQVIVPKVLSSIRKVPAQYDAVAFRGEKQGAAQDEMVESAGDALAPFGVKITVGALQNITYSDDVENSIKNVLVAQQKQQQAEAELQAAKVSAQQKVVEAQAEADANDVLAKSLSPEVLQSKQLDTLAKLGEKGNTFVVPNGTNPLLQVGK